jgi:hypothetical protein
MGIKIEYRHVPDATCVDLLKSERPLQIRFRPTIVSYLSELMTMLPVVLTTEQKVVAWRK